MKLSIKEKIGYGLGNFAGNLIFNTVLTFLMYFYTDIFGIPVAAVGTLFLISRLWDAINDPIMGAITDRTSTRWGRFRPYLLWMAVPVAVVAVLTFTTPDLSVKGKIIYAWITYIMLMMLFTSIDVPYTALSGVMTDDPMERTSLNSYRFGLMNVGNLISGALTLPLVALLGQGNQSRGYQLTILIFGIIAVLLYFISFASTKERIHPPLGQTPSLKADIKMLLLNRPWQVVFLGGILLFIFLSIRTSAVIYYFSYHIGNQDLVSPFMAAFSIASIIGILLVKPFVKLFGKRKTFVIGHLISMVNLAFFFMSSASIFWIFLVNIIAAIFFNLTPPILAVMVADTADYAEWKFGMRSTGIVFSALSFSFKFGMGIGGALGAAILAAFGYVSGGVEHLQFKRRVFKRGVEVARLGAAFVLGGRTPAETQDSQQGQSRQTQTPMSANRCIHDAPHPTRTMLSNDSIPHRPGSADGN